MKKHKAIATTAVDAVIRHWPRSLAIMLCLIAMLSPFLSALSILEGVKSQSRSSVEQGADIYVTMDLYGRNGVIPLAFVNEIRRMKDVVKVVPRAVGRVYINGRPAVLLGIPAGEAEHADAAAAGAVPKPGEVAVGARLARALNLGAGSDISIGTRAIGIVNGTPYALKKVYRVAGTLDPASDIRAADLVIMDIQDAAEVYGMDGFATDLAVYTRPGSEATVIDGLIGMNAAFRIQTRDLARTYVEGGLNGRGGIFTALYLAAIAAAIPAILVSSGIGLTERKKEIGVLKAIGWRTGEVMELITIENVLYAATGASAALLVSFFWVRLLNGFLIAKLFIPGIDALPSFPVPSRFLPLPFFSALCVALVVTMTGSLATTWRTSVVPPREVLR